ncbi:MAG: hypothetical protein ACOX7K_00540 [Oscillospiraceae bacterium]|jgi:hypothetical protein
MDRETLMQEVKGIYASISQQETQQHFHQTNSRVNPEKYYEKILNMVLNEISAGTFDRFQTGRAIVDAVSKDKRKWLSQWDESIQG